MAAGRGILFKNGRIGLGASDRGPDAVYAEDGKIAAIGASRELELQLTGRDYETADWDGAYVLPGLVDSHMHLGMQGVKLAALDFSDVTSKEDMLRLIRERAERTPAGEWILGLNWNENAFSPALPPLIDELDEAAGDRPAYLTRTCFHAFLANSEAFRRAGVTANTPDPESGAFGRDASGGLNGWVYEEASKMLEIVQPEPDYETKKEAIRRACRHALSLGLTAAHTEDLRYLGSLETMLRIHRELREEGLRFRSHQLVFHTFLDEAERLGLKAGDGDEWLRIGAAKIFSDGAIGGRTALLNAPYSDAPETKGMAIHPLDRLKAITSRARSLGFPIAVHAIGDGAADMTLSAMEAYPLQGVSELPDRFIHAQVLDEKLVRRMGRLQMIADIQPRFVPSDFPWVMERVGPSRTEYLYAWKKLISAGIVCAGGSDAPIEPLNPLLGLHAAVTRRRPDSPNPRDGYLPDERLSTEEAVRLFTEGSALAAAESHERGSIAEGRAADFTVLDRDLSGDPENMLGARALMTVVNGEVAYRA
ncbi:amidohydrolase [Saccharibacillus alkalitolerans]|uniref:Amidohydrolase n=1 Tax=Saccharibacillus alkalitolerans TaxID=2705290 RepID=A0ABX0F110_9BACL|nr:amidohydrolase [Saccharibacillus alkalitolerans]NGZ74113.1 amidohydrolase [Saccharibacillus alkalitolerans]